MSEIITSITEIENYHADGEESYYGGEDGYKIVTTEQEILLLIDNSQSCCENWGYLMSEDVLQKFIGAEIIGLAVTDTNRSSYDGSAGYEGDVMFVDIATSRGVLQFVAYNEHNGYYGHTARVQSKQLTHSEVL